MARLWRSDIRAAMTLLPPEGMTWLLKRASRICLRRAEARRVANQRGAGAKAFHKGQHGRHQQAALHHHGKALCHRFTALPDSVTGTALLAPWRRCTRGRHAPQLFLSALRQDASIGSPSAKESKTADHWTKPLRDIQQHAMARTPLDFVMSSRYESSIEHAFVFAGRPKLLAAEAA